MPNYRMSTFGTAVQNRLMTIARTASAMRKKRLQALQTKDDALRYIENIRKKIRSTYKLSGIGTPVRAQVTASFLNKGVRVENVIYESTPGYWVTANLYRPEGNGPFPCVLFLCGHSGNGKQYECYRNCACSLAKQGFMVLIVDPVGQGERHQYCGLPGAEKEIVFCCYEHNILGRQMLLCGQHFGEWRAQDALRGLDYLLARPEADPARVGVTGTSGGGTMTTIVSALDDRFTMIAPSCYITTWRGLIENELPVDAEQVPPGLFGKGCEMVDFLIASAPKPMLIMGQKNDFFDPRGTMEAYEELKQIYKLLGAEQNARCMIGPDSHGLTLPLRKAVYQFFGEYAGGLPPAPEECTVDDPEVLNCTKNGQMEYSDRCKSAHARIVEIMNEILRNRAPRTPEELRDRLSSLLDLPEDLKTPPPYRVLRPAKLKNDRFLARFALESEPGIEPVLKLVADQELFHLPGGRDAVLFVPHNNAERESQALRETETRPVFLLDVRGIGELMPSNCEQDGSDLLDAYGYDYHYASMSMLLGESYLAGKVRDILSALALLKSKGFQTVELVAKGQSSVAAILAALFSNCKLRIVDAPSSWECQVTETFPFLPQSAVLPGILKVTDLPEIVRTIRAEKRMC